MNSPVVIRSYKLVEYAYPTSGFAKQFGFEKTGCYLLQTADPVNGHRTFGGYRTAAKAREAGELYPHPWHEAMNEGWRAQ